MLPIILKTQFSEFEMSKINSRLLVQGKMVKKVSRTQSPVLSPRNRWLFVQPALPNRTNKNTIPVIATANSTSATTTVPKVGSD